MQSTMIKAIVEDFGNGGTIDGDLVVSGDLQVSGGGSLSFDEIVQATQVVEITNTEALLVRKASDGGDVFIVDTQNNDVTVGSSSLADGTLIIESNSSGDPKLQFTSTANRIGIMDFVEAGTLQGSIVYDHNGDNLKFATGSTNRTARFVLNETSSYFTSRVGIGESSSIDKKLHIKSSTSGDGITIENSSTGASVIRFEADSSALRGLIGVEDHDGGSSITGSSGYATFIRSEADIQFASGGNNLAMTIDSSQNVGIGVSSSISARLHIDTPTDGNTIQFDRSGQETYKLFHGTSGLFLSKPNSNNVAVALVTQDGDFYTKDASDNFLLFSDTSASRVGINDSSPDAILDVDNANSTSSTIVHITDSDTGAGNHTALQFNNTTGGGSVQTVAQFNTVGTDLKINAVADLVLQDTGANLGVGTASPSSTMHIFSSTADGHLIVESTHAFSSGNVDIRSVADRDSFLMFREGSTVKAQIFNDSSEDTLVLTDGANANTVFIKSNKVGIGIANPSTALEIDGGIIQNTSNPFTQMIDTSGGGDTYGLNNNSSKFSIYNWTDSREELVFDGSGSAKFNGSILSSDRGTITNASGEFSAFATSGNILKLGANGSDNHLKIDTNGHITATGIKSFLPFYDDDGSTLSGYVGSGQDLAFGDANDLCIRGVDSIKFTANNGNADAMTIDSSGNVGIGTSSPQKLMHLDSSSGFAEMRLSGTSGGGTIEFYNDSTALGDIFFDTSKRFHVRTNGATTALTIDENQNVGIGTTSPTASKLSLSHANNTDYDSYKSNMGATASTHHAVNITNSSNEDNTNERYALLNFLSGYGNSAAGQSIIGNVSTGSKQGNFIIGTRGGDSDANVTEKFRVSYDGNVGIGNSSPSEKLDVTGNIQASGTISSTATSGNNIFNSSILLASGKNLFLDGGSNTFIKEDGADTITFTTAGSERVRITQAGVLELTSGQLKFPASQVASSDANTLDDYEEGTFTPVWSAGSGTLGTINYTSQIGRYTKIGDVVHFSISFYNGAFAVGSGSGQARISGLPFTSNSTNGKSACSVGISQYFTGQHPSTAEVLNNQTSVDLLYRDAADGATALLQVSDLQAGGSGVFNLINISGTYFV